MAARIMNRQLASGKAASLAPPVDGVYIKAVNAIASAVVAGQEEAEEWAELIEEDGVPRPRFKVLAVLEEAERDQRTKVVAAPVPSLRWVVLRKASKGLVDTPVRYEQPSAMVEGLVAGLFRRYPPGESPPHVRRDLLHRHFDNVSLQEFCDLATTQEGRQQLWFAVVRDQENEYAPPTRLINLFGPTREVVVLDPESDSLRVRSFYAFALRQHDVDKLCLRGPILAKTCPNASCPHGQDTEQQATLKLDLVDCAPGARNAFLTHWLRYVAHDVLLHGSRQDPTDPAVLDRYKALGEELAALQDDASAVAAWEHAKSRRLWPDIARIPAARSKPEGWHPSEPTQSNGKRTAPTAAAQDVLQGDNSGLVRDSAALAAAYVAGWAAQPAVRVYSLVEIESSRNTTLLATGGGPAMRLVEMNRRNPDTGLYDKVPYYADEAWMRTKAEVASVFQDIRSPQLAEVETEVLYKHLEHTSLEDFCELVKTPAGRARLWFCVTSDAEPDHVIGTCFISLLTPARDVRLLDLSGNAGHGEWRTLSFLEFMRQAPLADLRVRGPVIARTCFGPDGSQDPGQQDVSPLYLSQCCPGVRNALLTYWLRHLPTDILLRASGEDATDPAVLDRYKALGEELAALQDDAAQVSAWTHLAPPTAADPHKQREKQKKKKNKEKEKGKRKPKDKDKGEKRKKKQQKTDASGKAGPSSAKRA